MQIFPNASFCKWYNYLTAPAQQPKRLDDHMITAQTTAAQRRAQLANAHAKYFSSHRTGNDSLELFNCLTRNNVVMQDQHVVDIQMESTTIVITVDNEQFRETIELDAYGNTLRGVGA